MKISRLAKPCGLGLIAIVGLFALGEVFIFLESRGKHSSIGVKLEKVTVPVRDIAAACGQLRLREEGAKGFLHVLEQGQDGHTVLE